MDLGGIDVNHLVTQLMALERRPLNALATRKSNAQKTVDAFNALKTQIGDLSTLTAKLTTSSGIAHFTTSLSNTKAGSATSTAFAAAGSLTFEVTSLGGTSATRSSAPGLTASSAATTADFLAIGTKAGEVGITALTKVNDDPASITSSQTYPPTKNINAGNNTVTVLVNGQFKQIEIDVAPGGEDLDATEIQSRLQDALAEANVDLTVSLEAGALKLTAGASVKSFAVAADDFGFSDGAATGGYSLAQSGYTTVFNGAPTSGSHTVLSGAGQTSTTVKLTSTGDKSIASVAAAITSAGGAITAAAVNSGTGTVLQLQSTVGGSTGEIAIGAGALDLLGGFTATSTGGDAVITVGKGTAGEYTINGTGNTFADLLPGVTFTATTAGETTTLTVAGDNAALANEVEALVAKVNAVLQDIKVKTFWNSETKTGGPLLGDSTARRLAAQLTSALSAPVGDIATGQLPSLLGIELQKDGTFKFDKARFTAAIGADPGLAEAFLKGTTETPGIATRLDQVSRDITHWENGLLTNATKGAQERVKLYNSQIDRLEQRLEVRETNMFRQWSALQSLLASMQNQGTWLQGQLATLSTNYSGR